jgi:hypothetical protein
MRGRIAIAVLGMAVALLSISVTGRSGASTEPAWAKGEQSLRTQDASLDETVALTGDAASHSILQFKAGGHLLGFQPNRAYLVALDHALSVEFLGTPGVMPQAVGDSGPKSGNSGASALGKVVYPGLWEGIRLVYAPDKDGIAESTYEVGPGADVSRIRLCYNVPVALQKDGSLRFSFERGVLSESAPVAWQEMDGKRVPVEVAFRVSGDEVGFRVGAYDSSRPLIIDPTYAWHTFYGSAGDDFGHGLAVDAGGNVYVTGYSPATWNGPAGQPPLHTHSGGSTDLFVLKLNSSGDYLWHTFYGSASDDYGVELALDAGGNVYVTGWSLTTWNGPAAQAPLHAHSDGYDLLVLKLNTSGAYQWHTFYVGTSAEFGWGLAVDAGGNVYVAGNSGDSDLYILKLNSSGAYQWQTFYGGLGKDFSRALAVDAGGNVYITGYSDASWLDFSGTQVPLHTHSGGYDLFVLKLNSSGAYLWHTFYGSANTDEGHGLAVDTVGNVYVTGYSMATWNGPAAQAPLHTHSGGYDLYLLKLNSSGAYQWHTFYGSASNDDGWALALDAGGNVYVTGNSFATWNGPAGQAPIHTHSGGYDLFVLKLNNNGTYQWHTYHGSTNFDAGVAPAVDAVGNVYVAGYSTATWNGPAGQTPLHAHGGSNDLFVLKMDQSLLAADFGGSGLWLYQDGGWNWISGSNPQGVAYAAGISTLYVDFGDQGLWQYNGTSWRFLDASNPEAIVASPTALYVDFGVYGLYRYAAGSWTWLTSADPKKMVVSGDNLFVDFGAGALWRYNSAWTLLDSGNREDIAASGSVLYVDCGVFGLWKYSGVWALLTSANPEKMVTSGDNLFVDFGAAGIWRYNGVWTMLDTSNPEDIAAFGSTLLVDFGIYGLYKYEAGSWTLLSSSNPEAMTVGGAVLYADFGAGGLWKYERNAWSFLSATNPESLAGYIP